MMRLRWECFAIGLLPLIGGQALAQSSVSPGEILQSLTGASGAAQAVAIDVNAIRSDIEQRIKVEGTENAASPPPVLQALATLPNLTLVIEFDLDSDRIQPRSYPTLGYMADALHHPILLSYKFVVAGHCDASGSRAHNLDLSQRRAAAVVEALTTTFRVDADQLVALGLGEEQLRDPSDPTGAANRRVQLLNIGPR
jgi:outer membrane protein OmpA-like peptidoglycan-associated protein